MEEYRSGHNGPHSKCGSPLQGSWVRIPPLPPFLKNRCLFFERMAIFQQYRQNKLLRGKEINMNSIFKRASVRSYKNTQVEDSKLELLIRAAMAAPSAGNQQPWEFYVVKDKDVLRQLSAATPYAGCAKNAPAAIIPCYRKEGLRFSEYAQIDMSICCENILLEATELGLGAVWLGIAPIEERMKAVEEILHIPQNLAAFAIIPVGYPPRG